MFERWRRKKKRPETVPLDLKAELARAEAELAETIARRAVPFDPMAPAAATPVDPVQARPLPPAPPIELPPRGKSLAPPAPIAPLDPDRSMLEIPAVSQPSGTPSLEAPAALQTALDSIKPDGTSDRRLAPEEVTGVLDLAFQRLDEAQAASARSIDRAAARLKRETRATRALSQDLLMPSPPPPKKPPQP